MMRTGNWWANNYFIEYQDYLRFCKWNGKIFPCTDAFANHVTDILTCFTFNPGERMAKFFIESKTGINMFLVR